MWGSTLTTTSAVSVGAFSLRPIAMLAVTFECPSEFFLPSRILRLNGLALATGGRGRGPDPGVDMILASMFWSVREPLTTWGGCAGTRFRLNSRVLDLILLSTDSTSRCAAFHLGRIFGVRFTQARRVRCPRIMRRRLRQMEFLFHVGVTQEHPGEVGSSSSSRIKVFDHHLGSTTNQCHRAVEVRVGRHIVHGILIRLGQRLQRQLARLSRGAGLPLELDPASHLRPVTSSPQ